VFAEVPYLLESEEVSFHRNLQTIRKIVWPSCVGSHEVSPNDRGSHPRRHESSIAPYWVAQLIYALTMLLCVENYAKY